MRTNLDSDIENLVSELAQPQAGTFCLDSLPSPSPRPSPLGRGRHARRFSNNPGALVCQKAGQRFSLSPRERAGVRGKEVVEGLRCPLWRNLRRNSPANLYAGASRFLRAVSLSAAVIGFQIAG